MANYLYKINSLLKGIFPQKIYLKIRMKLLAFYRSRLHVFSEAEIRDVFINELGVKEKSVVFVHSSISKIRLDFQFYRLVRILQEIVGPEGTLLFPCWQNIEDYKEYADSKTVFDVKKTPTILGILPEIVRRERSAYRSLSPINSVVAIGKDAQKFTGEHHKDILPWGIHSPLYKLVAAEAIIIGIGVTTRYLTFVHCVEDTFPSKFPVQTRSSEIYTFLVKSDSGEIMEVKSKIPHPNVKHRDVPAFIKAHINSSIACDRKIKQTDFFTANAKELYFEMQSLAKKNITIYSIK